MGLRELELANARGQQQGNIGFSGTQDQGPGLGSQILGGGGAGLAQGLAQGFGSLGGGGGNTSGVNEWGYRRDGSGFAG
jgi:hypothetical protein